MIADSIRIEAFAKALESTVRPGMTVLDLGAGAGILSLLSCRYGASKVYAIDTADSIIVGREMAEANEFGDRIEWYHQSSSDITLPERVDLVVADLRGALPFYCGSIASIIDARDRFLKPGGSLISLRDRCYIALAEAPDLYAETVCPWGENDFAFDWGPVRSRMSNRWINAAVESEQLISGPELWCSIDYRTVDDPNVENEVSLTCLRSGETHGFFVWFETDLTEEVGFSGAPGITSPEVYGSGFFPFSHSVRVSEGDCAAIRLSARDLGDEYLWRWKSDLGGERFDQSTFHSLALNSEILQRSG